jgi:hypothetical protein
MRISIKHVRVALIGANLALALAFAFHYAYSMAPESVAKWVGFLAPEQRTMALALRDPLSFRYREGQRPTKEDPASAVSAVAVWVQPQKKIDSPPPPLDGEKAPTDETPETATGEGPQEGGPLAKDWEYVHAVIVPDDPLLSFATLAKKDATSGEGTAPGSRAGGTSGRNPSVPSSRYRRGSTAGKTSLIAQTDEPLIVYLRRRHYVDEERGLDFWVESIDAERFVYWTDDPKKMFVLKFKSGSDWVEEGREKHLPEIAPPKEADEEKSAGDGAEDEEKPHIVLVPRDFQDLREKDYEKIKAGEKPAGHLEAVDLTKERRAREKAGAVRTPNIAGGGAAGIPSKYPGGQPPAGQPGAPAKSEAEQKADLGKAIKDALTSDKATAEDKAKLQETQEMIQGKPARGAAD